MLTSKSQVGKVISNDFCIGCGACTLGLLGGPLSVTLTSLGFLQAVADPKINAVSDLVCPFSNLSLNEDQIVESVTSSTINNYHCHLGKYAQIYAGHVAASDYREQASSGGFTTWILAQLLRLNYIDAILHVKPRQPDGDDKRIFKYGVSKTPKELYSGAKSHYYPVEMSEVLSVVRNTPGRYVIVGVPCFIKAIRLLCLHEAIFAERILFCVGLFCGHLKSTGFAEMMAWQVGIKPDSLQAFDFRTKVTNQPASNYAITAQGLKDGVPAHETKSKGELIGTDWGTGYFKYKACDFCDDIAAETADVSVGDAWLPEYVEDSMGTNVVIIRNSIINQIVLDGLQSGELSMQPLSVDKAVASQSANVRHRREDLPYRLYLHDLTKSWRPQKRLHASKSGLSLVRRRIQKARIRFRQLIPLAWHHAVQNDDLQLFIDFVMPLEGNYSRLYAAISNPKRKNYSIVRTILVKILYIPKRAYKAFLRYCFFFVR